MKDTFKAVRVSDNVWWVGAIDWTTRDFHGYTTKRGSTYNAYLVMADKITLIDTVKKPFVDELLARIQSVVPLEIIDYIVSNHSEPDHTSGLTQVIKAVQPKKVFASKMGQKALEAHYQLGGIEAVDNGGTLDLGNMALSFIETRMVHWPDSMFSYLDKDAVLFSQDGFGMHLASSERFADEIPQHILDYEAATYYANILLPFSDIIAKTLENFAATGIQPAIIAPDHGPIWRKEPMKIVEQYARWTKQEPTNKVAIVYDTMWGSTDIMARAIGEGAAAAGSEVILLSMHSDHRSAAAYETMRSGALLIGSPTLNNNMFPTVADVLTYLKGLKPLNKVAAAFGSYGWSGEAHKQIDATLREMKLDVIQEPVGLQYVPNADGLKQCRDLGASVAGRLKELL